ncbi:MAG: hypothetical protein P8Y61_04810 [Gammaproteobacteria bacterium]
MQSAQRAWITAILALLAGAAIYLLGRDWSTVYLLAWTADAQAGGPALRLGAWSGRAPSFAHAFGFAVLTALMLGGGRKNAAVACLFWGATDAFLELLQRPEWSVAIPQLPFELAAWPLFDNLHAYFQQGQFDLLDIVAIALGAFAAWLVARSLPVIVIRRPIIWRNSHATETAES